MRGRKIYKGGNMETTLSSKAESIQMIYTNYVNHKYIVNRNYQRKLVWAIDEKEAFIDSIIKSYSVPLFLVAQKNDGNGGQLFEIIDGMQRLNAICSFLENEFAVELSGKQYFFDLETLADTKSKKEKNILKQKTPILSHDICLKIVNYQIPFSFIIADKENIEEIFRRINSYGKKLSEQEIRQAGALGKFPNLVRKTSAGIRGDVSISDLINLENMKNISITSKGLRYGISMDDLFWIKNSIITKNNIRVSRDEELIAYIYSYILLDKTIQPSSKTLDALYDFNINEENLASKADDFIEKYGFDNLIKKFDSTFDLIKRVIDISNKNFKLLIFDDKNASGLVRTFQVIFLALYELQVTEGMFCSNINLLAQKLNCIGKNHLSDISSEKWDAKYRNEKIISIKEILKDCFENKIGENVATENWIIQLENLLQNSELEGGQFDFKQGLCTLETNQHYNEKLIEKYLKTLTAEVNKGPSVCGYVILGISDKKNDAEKIQNFYSTKYRTFKNSKFFITGLNGEIKKFFNNDNDAYLRKLKAEIKNSKSIDEYSKTYILTNLKFVNYYELSIIVLRLKSRGEPIAFSDRYYKRENDETIEVKGAAEISALFSLFNKTTNNL